MKSPFKFLDAYALEDKAVFFGRDKEVNALYDLLFRTPIVLLHGLSGTGKTSLIQCGLAGRFEGPDWYPFFIRRGQDINQSVRAELDKALPERPVGDDLPAYIQQIFESYYSPVYLIFDQFEELFILGKEAERKQFVADLKAILDAELPCKILLVLREEYLGRLYEFEEQISYLFDFRLRVEPMGRSRVTEVLEQSFAAFNISLEEPAAERLDEIIRNVSGEKAGIELPYLQIYLDLLYKEDYQDTYPGQERGEELPPLTFTQQEIEQFGPIEDVLEKFLYQQEQEISEQLNQQHPNLPSNVVRAVLDIFVTEEGTKQPLRFHRPQGSEQMIIEDAEKLMLPDIPAAALVNCIEALEQSRLLGIGDTTIELAHDKLAALIHEQRTEAQRNLIRARARLKFALEENALSGAFLNAKQLEDLEPYLPQLEKEPGVAAFIAANQQYLADEEAAKLEQQQRELKLAQEKLAAQKRASRRQRLFLALISLVLVFAAWQWWQAQQNLVLANDASKEAQANEALAKQNEQAAKDNLDLAQQRELEAAEARDSALYQKQLADAAATEATKAKNQAQKALADLQTASAKILDNILAAAEPDLLNLDYEAALDKYRTAAALKVDDRKVGRAMLEVAYFYSEAHQFERAIPLLDTVQLLYGGGRLEPVFQDTLEEMRTIMAGLDADRLNELQLRYYPEMVTVPGGTFGMGCDSTLQNNNCYDLEKPLHEVKLGSYEIAKTETTNWQFHLFVQATGYDNTAYLEVDWKALGLGDRPAARINWYDAVHYANWLSAQQNNSLVYTIDTTRKDPNNKSDFDNYKWLVELDTLAQGYRLPTEAEWEFAAQGGRSRQDFVYSGSNDLDSVGWYSKNSNSRPHAVGGKPPNALGLYDMSGNVWEWCWDWYGDYEEGQEVIVNPRGSTEGSSRVIRGGGWISGSAQYCRVSYRSSGPPVNRFASYGFRLVRSL